MEVGDGTSVKVIAPRRAWISNGPLWLTAGALFFAVMAVLVRLAGQRGIPGSETTLIRFLFGLATVAVLQASGAAEIRIRRVPLLVVRGVTGGVAILFYFLSLSAAKGPGSTSLTNSVFLGNSYFIYAPLFGALLIRERLCLGTVLMIGAALAGLYLVAQPSFGSIRAGDAYGFGAGVFGGLALVIVRELRKTESAFSIFLSLCVFGALAGLITMITQRPIWPDRIGWLILLAMGISSTAGQLSLTYAMRWARAGEAGLISMTTVIYSSLAGVLWLGDPFDVVNLAGAILVLGSAAYISLAQSQECLGE